MRPTLAVLFLVNVLNFYDRQALGAVLEPLRREFHLTRPATRRDSRRAFIIVYALAGIPLARLADRWSRKRMLAIGVSVWAALTALGGASTGYAMLFATRLGVGIGEAVCAPAATSWIGDLVPPQERSRRSGRVHDGGARGDHVELRGERSGGAGVRLADGARVGGRAGAAAGSRRCCCSTSRRARRSPRLPRRRGSLLRIPALWWITLSGAMVNFILYSFSYFVAAFLTRFHGLSVAQAGVWSGLGRASRAARRALAVVAFGGATALRGGPRACWRLRWRGSRSGSRAGAHAAIVLLMLAYGLWQMYYGPVYAAIQDIVPPELRATAMSMYFLGMYLLRRRFRSAAGRSVERPLRARRRAGVRPAEPLGLHDAMYVMPLMSIVLAAVLWWSARVSRVVGNSRSRL